MQTMLSIAPGRWVNASVAGRASNLRPLRDNRLAIVAATARAYTLTHARQQACKRAGLGQAINRSLMSDKSFWIDCCEPQSARVIPVVSSKFDLIGKHGRNTRT